MSRRGNPNPDFFSAKEIIVKPYNPRQVFWGGVKFDTIQINNIDFYISLDESGRSFDQFPSSVVSTPIMLCTKKFTPIEALELRGSSLQEGFRSKKGTS